MSDLAEYVAESEEAQGDVCRAAFPLHGEAADPGLWRRRRRRRCKETFASDECNIKRLIVEIATRGSGLGPVEAEKRERDRLHFT